MQRQRARGDAHAAPCPIARRDRQRGRHVRQVRPPGHRVRHRPASRLPNGVEVRSGRVRACTEVTIAKVRVADALDSATDSAIKLQRARSYKVDLVAERIDRCACSALLVEGASEVHEMDVAQACREQGMVSGHELRFRPRPSIGAGRQDRQPAHRFASPHCERRTPSGACIEENWCLCCERGNDAARYLVLRNNASAMVTPTAVGPGDGACGTARDVPTATAPLANLCESPSLPSAVTSSSTQWQWTCSGTNGGATTACSAPKITTAAPPSAPTIYRIASRPGGLIVFFSPPSDDGGSPITGYTATCTDGSSPHVQTALLSPISVTQLVNGTSYECTVHASNDAGHSAESAAVSRVAGKVNGIVPLLGIILQ